MAKEADTQLDLFPEISGYTGEWHDLPNERTYLSDWVLAFCMDNQQGDLARFGAEGPRNLQFPIV